MNFVAVPPGTAHPAALALRGADHVLEVPSADDFQNTLGATLRSNVVGGQAQFSYASAGGAMCGFFFTNDAAVLSTSLHAAVADPAKLRALWLHQVADGLAAGNAMSLDTYSAAGEACLGKHALNALPAAYLLTAADLYHTEVPAGALGGAGTMWARSAGAAQEVGVGLSTSRISVLSVSPNIIPRALTAIASRRQQQ